MNREDLGELKNLYENVICEAPLGLGSAQERTQQQLELSRARVDTIINSGKVTAIKPQPMKEQSQEWSSAKTIRDIADAYSSIYEAKKQVDQDQDGDNDFADVRIARMVASGVPKEVAIAKVRNKSYNKEEYEFDEGLGSAIRRVFGNRKKPEATPSPEGRTAQLRRKYNVTSRTGPESPRGRILSRAQTQINADIRKYGEGSTPAKESEAARNRQLKGGYSQFGMNDRRGRGNKARKRIQEEAYEIYEIVASYLLENNFAETLNDANVIIENMSENWIQSIIDEY